MKRTRILLVLSVALGAATGASAALGGAHETHEVTVSRDSASGTLWAARESRDATQFIGCTASGVTVCEASDAAGNRFFCMSGNPSIHDRAMNIRPTSWIWIKRGTSSCSNLIVRNYSQHLPGPTRTLTPIDVGGQL